MEHVWREARLEASTLQARTAPLLAPTRRHNNKTLNTWHPSRGAGLWRLRRDPKIVGRPEAQELADGDSLVALEIERVLLARARLLLCLALC